MLVKPLEVKKEKRLTKYDIEDIITKKMALVKYELDGSIESVKNEGRDLFYEVTSSSKNIKNEMHGWKLDQENY